MMLVFVISYIVALIEFFFSSNYDVKGNMLVVKNIDKTKFGYFQVFASNGFHEIASTAFLNVQGTKV